MDKCSATTRKNQPCPFYADRLTDGVLYCHIHDPQGVFQQQVKAKRERKKNWRARVNPPQKKNSLVRRIEMLEQRMEVLEALRGEDELTREWRAVAAPQRKTAEERAGLAPWE